jgi:hypothetical protein
MISPRNVNGLWHDLSNNVNGPPRQTRPKVNDIKT